MSINMQSGPTPLSYVPPTGGVPYVPPAPVGPTVTVATPTVCVPQTVTVTKMTAPATTTIGSAMGSTMGSTMAAPRSVAIVHAEPKKGVSGVCVVLIALLVIAALVALGWILWSLLFDGNRNVFASSAVGSTDQAFRDRVSQAYAARRQEETPANAYADARGQTGGVMELPDQNSFVTAVSGQCVIAFVADWCHFCKLMKPELDGAAQRCSVPIYTLSSDQSKPWVHALVTHYGVKGFPTLIKFSNGQPVAEYNGERKAASIITFAQN